MHDYFMEYLILSLLAKKVKSTDERNWEVEDKVEKAGKKGSENNIHLHLTNGESKILYTVDKIRNKVYDYNKRVNQERH